MPLLLMDGQAMDYGELRLGWQATALQAQMGQGQRARRGRPGRDPRRQEHIDEPVIEVEPSLIHRAAARGKNPRPGNAEPVGADAQRFHQRDVFLVAVVVVAGHLRSAAILDEPWLRRVRVPDRRPSPIDIVSPFDLKGGCGDAPHKAPGKGINRHLGSPAKRPVKLTNQPLCLTADGSINSPHRCQACQPRDESCPTLAPTCVGKQT